MQLTCKSRQKIYISNEIIYKSVINVKNGIILNVLDFLKKRQIIIITFVNFVSDILINIYIYI